jgi:hypothetical protein
VRRRNMTARTGDALSHADAHRRHDTWRCEARRGDDWGGRFTDSGLCAER